MAWQALWRGLVRGAWMLALLPGIAAASDTTPRPMVLSIDDGPSLATHPLMSPQQRHTLWRDTLARQGVTAVMYVTLGFGADRPEGMALARRWADAGHLLGNHTVTHPDIDDEKKPLQSYLDEIDACEQAMSGLRGWRRWFRATYLHEGARADRRDGLSRDLQARGYRIAPVQLDSRDWQYAARFEQALQSGAPADSAALKAAFMTQLLERARALPPQPGGAPAVLLMHDTLLSALQLDEVLRGLQAQGFAFVHPERAMPGSSGP